MSLKHVHLLSLVKKQYQYKMKTYIGVFSTIIIVQLIALVFSSSGGTSSSGGPSGLTISIDYYSADVVIGFTMLAICINAFNITTKTFQEDDFIFVTNRLSGNLANILFLVTVSIFAGVTAMLSGFLVRMFWLLFGSGSVLGEAWDVGLLELLYGIGAPSAYMLLAGAIGYIAGSIVQMSKIFIFILPVAAWGVLVFPVDNQTQVAELIVSFFYQETSILLLLLKVIVVSVILFLISVMMTNGKEVRR